MTVPCGSWHSFTLALALTVVAPTQPQRDADVTNSETARDGQIASIECNCCGLRPLRSKNSPMIRFDGLGLSIAE